VLQATVGALYGVDGSREIGDVTLPAVWVYGAAATDDHDRTQKAHINTRTHHPMSVSILIVVMMDDYQ
jgi:hypothetical protein